MPSLKILIDARGAAPGAAEFDAQAKKVQASATAAARSVDGMGRSSERTGEKVKRTAKSSDQAAKSATGMGTASARASVGMESAAFSAGRLERASVGMSAGFAQGAKSLGAFALGLAAFKAATETRSVLVGFEQGLVGVGKTTGIAGKELSELGKQFTDLSTRIPVSSEKLLEIGQAAGQLGVKGSANILKFAETLARLESASDLDGTEGATQLARILNVTGESIGNIDVLGSVIVRLGNDFATTESSIAAAATRIAAAGAVYGVTSTEAAALATAFSATGTEAELSGSTIAKSFDKITAAVIEGGASLDLLARISGTTGPALKEAFLGGDSVGVLNSFIEGLGKLDPQEFKIALDELGLSGLRTGPTLGKLAANFGVLEKAMADASDEAKVNTALINESDQAFDTLGASGKALGLAFSAIIQDGTGLNDSLSSILVTSADIVKSISGVGSVSRNAGEGVAIAAIAVKSLAAASALAFGARASTSLLTYATSMHVVTVATRTASGAAGIAQVRVNALSASLIRASEFFKANPIVLWTAAITAAAVAVRQLTKDSIELREARAEALDTRSAAEQFAAGGNRIEFGIERNDQRLQQQGLQEQSGALSQAISEALKASGSEDSGALLRASDLERLLGAEAFSEEKIRKALVEGMIAAAKESRAAGGSPFDIARAVELEANSSALIKDDGRRFADGSLSTIPLRTFSPDQLGRARGFTQEDKTAPVTNEQIRKFAEDFAKDFEAGVVSGAALPLLQSRLDKINSSLDKLRESNLASEVSPRAALGIEEPETGGVGRGDFESLVAESTSNETQALRARLSAIDSTELSLTSLAEAERLSAQLYQRSADAISLSRIQRLENIDALELEKKITSEQKEELLKLAQSEFAIVDATNERIRSIEKSNEAVTRQQFVEDQADARRDESNRKFQEDNAIRIGATRQAASGLGDAVASGLLGIRDLGTSIKEVFQNVIQSLIAARVEALILKAALPKNGDDSGSVVQAAVTGAVSGLSNSDSGGGDLVLPRPKALGGLFRNGFEAFRLGGFPDGLISGPTTFAIAGGAVGLAGEAGQEVGFSRGSAIAPLEPDPLTGKLGVNITGGGGRGRSITNKMNFNFKVEKGADSRGIRLSVKQAAQNARNIIERGSR